MSTDEHGFDRLQDLVSGSASTTQMRRLNHVLIIFDPRAFEIGELVGLVEVWDGTDEVEFLQLLADTGVAAAVRIQVARPERALAYRNYCRRTGEPMLIRAA